MTSMEQLSRWLCESASTIAFTGAGMSTESGIADFRSPGGVWDRFQPVYFQEFVASHAARVRYWAMRRELYREFADAKPNAGHHALAKLEQQSKLQAVITQNIDGLHQDAGSQHVIEIHGTARRIGCIECSREVDADDIRARLESGAEECFYCEACGGPLKSMTISFGQAMPEREMTRAAELSESAELFLAIGSSLVVQPAASLPRIAKLGGARLVIVNHDETPLDGHADLMIREPIGDMLPAAVDAMFA